MEKSTQISTIKKYQRKFSIYLPVILINSVLRTGKYYYPRLFSEDYKYLV